VIAENKTVQIEYTLKLDDGSVADTSVGGEPLQYLHGGQQILPGLENALTGLAVGATQSVSLSPEDGYGIFDPDLLQEVPLTAVPEDARQPGSELVSEDENGNQQLVRVHEVRSETILIDLNHPLAGQTLHFDVRVVGVE